MASQTKRAKYTANFKLKVVAFAIENNNCAAARRFDVSEKLVRDWKKNKSTIENMPKKKCALRGKPCQWPDLENVVKEWVFENRQSGYIVTKNSIRLFAHNWGKKNQKNSENFKATNSWCTRFMKRNELVIRQKTKIAQKLPSELDDKIVDFHRFVIGKRREYDFSLGCIGNMDETPMCFDMPGNRTVETKGKKTVLLKTTGHEKTRFTVVLTCLADGRKLKPMIILKRKTLPKIKIPQGIFVHVHPKGWMDEEGLKLWINNVWNKCPESWKSERRLLVWDSFRPHITADIKRRLQSQKTDTAVIPGGLTSILQPLDVCLNKPFKDYVKTAWNKWLMEGEKTFTKTGNIRVAPIDVVCNMIIEAWNDINSEIVIKAFKKCGISNSLDGTEDDILWDSDAGDETESVEEWDPYDNEVNEPDFSKLVASDSEEEFSGFQMVNSTICNNVLKH